MERKETPKKLVPPQQGELDFSLLGVLRTLWQWRKPIIYVTAAAFIGTILISLLLSNYYKAETRFLAINPDRLNPFVIAGLGGDKTPLYGNRNDIDRIMAIAESSELVNYLVDKYDLYERYEIDTNSIKAPMKVREKFFSLYEVTKTPRDAILIEVEDKDPELAAVLANDARDQINEIGRNLIMDGVRADLDVLRQDREAKENLITSMTDSLRQLRSNYSILDLGAQMRDLSGKNNELTQDITGLKAKIRTLEGMDNFKGKRDSLAKYNLDLASLQDIQIGVDSQMRQVSLGMEPVMGFNEGRNRLNLEKFATQQRIDLYESALQSKQGVIKVLEVATAPVIKSRPKRSFIVLGATFVAFLLSVLAVLAIEHSRQFDWEKITK